MFALRLSCLALLAACTRSEVPIDAASEASREASTVDAGVRDASPMMLLDASPPDPAAMATRGKALYGKYCNFCHGDEGKGYKADEAPALANDDLLATASDAFLEHAILKGRPGTTMSAWSLVRGGPLGTSQAQDLIAFMRTWQKRPSETSDAGGDGGPGDAGNTGDPERGAPLYAASCASCHGAKGVNGKHNALANPELLASASDAFLATTIERGRAGTPMAAWKGKLSAQQIGDIVALLRSWQHPPDDIGELPPRPGALVGVVLNPRGGQPPFDAAADFVPVDTVKKELDRKSSMVIIDARPPGDYARMHVAGAISAPFYEVDKYAPQIPKDRYLLTYCACPHGSSVKARDALRALGYKRVAVLDEGINAWRDRGYGVRGGPKP